MDSEERLADILGDWYARLEQGEDVRPEDYIEEHPDLADELRARFAALDLVDLALSSPPRRGPPERIGSYRIQRELGAGGMGTVYLAEAQEATPGGESVRLVALKVIHPHLLKVPGFFKRFLREADAGKRVRQENVVRTYDADALHIEGETVHFLVMEYVEGQTLKQLLEELGTVPEALLREIGLQIAAGLAAIHGAGIVHRDLKPENVLITDDHRIRIMDLGVARHVAKSVVLTREGQFAGTLHYAAPEQFRRVEVGPAADLYSLGLVLYELVTGNNPFRRDEPAAVMNAHLTEMPPRASRVVPEVSPFFSEVLATLLAKEPEERFGGANELRNVLFEGEDSPWWMERERVLLKAGTRIPRVPVRRETELYGRESDLQLLKQAWMRARSGEGQTILVEGEAGIGKSRLVDSFLDSLDGDDAHILYGSYPPSGGLGGLSDSILAHLGSRNLEEGLRQFLTVSPSLVPAFAAMVRHESPAEGSAAIEGEALHAAFCCLMRGLEKERPLLWIVEDLHFAGLESRQILLSLARALEGRNVLLLLTTRPGLPEAEWANFTRLSNFLRNGLRRLSAREVILLLQDAFRSEVLADKLGARIALKSDGIPFFVFEMIRGLKEGQFITELPDGSYVETKQIDRIEVPSAVRGLIEARLEDLGMGPRALLDVGAVQGFEFDPHLLATVLDMKRIPVLQALAEIERHSGVVQAAGRVYRFDHHQIQEVIYEQLSEPLRAEYHSALADAFGRTEMGAVRKPEDLKGESEYFLAFHHLRGSRPLDGLTNLDGALAHLKGAFRHEEAIDLADRAFVALGPDASDRRIELLLCKIEHLNALGLRAEERSTIEEASELAADSAEPLYRARTAGALGLHLLNICSFREAREVLVKAFDLAGESGGRTVQLSVSATLGNVLRSLGRYEEAREVIESLTALAAEAGDVRMQAGAVNSAGVVLQCLGRMEEAREYHERALALAREHGLRLVEAGAHLELGNTPTDWEEGIEHFESCLSLAREAGHRGMEANSLGSLGTAHFRLGRHREAEDYWERGRAIAREIGDRQWEGMITGHLGMLAFETGRYRVALRRFEQWVAVAREVESEETQVVALANLGPLHREMGDLEGARRILLECLAASDRIGTRNRSGYALYELGKVSEYSGDPEEALKLHGEALDVLTGLSDKYFIADVLAELGALLAALGRFEEAESKLTEALSLANQLGETGLIVTLTCQLALLRDGDVGCARAVFEQHAPGLGVVTRMGALFHLWRAAGDAEDLDGAHGLLCHLMDRAPEEFRESMIENVPLHRDIMAAWEKHRAAP